MAAIRVCTFCISMPFCDNSTRVCVSGPQAELEQERHQHEETLASMKEEEKLKADRMAHDLEIKWTENLRYTGFALRSSWYRGAGSVPVVGSLLKMC